jgi:serine/threonine protein kinase
MIPIGEAAPRAAGCLSDDEILALVTGGGEADFARFDEHLDSCPSCFDLVSIAAQNLSTAPPSRGPDEPPAARPPRTQLTLARGHVVGDRYEILGILGVGGMSVVYLARDPVLDRHVALKILRRDQLSLDAGIRLRLIREARTVSRLSHPNVVVVFDVGNLEHEVFIVLEHIDGQTAREHLAARPWSLREIMDVYLGASRGLIAAHAAGIIHRDFKPDNVLVGKDGRVRVTDFGLAHILSHNSDAPREPAGDASVLTGFLIGTPAYMAPEQQRGLAADARSDQYSFCVALFEALHGVRPVPGQRAAAGAIPAGLHAALLRGLQPAPEDRFPAMQALADALADPLAREQPPAPAALDVPEALRGTLDGLTGGWDLPRRDIVHDRMHAAAAPTWAPNQHRTDARTERWFAAVRGSQAAFAALDIERYLAYFTPDAVSSEPMIPSIPGREALRPFIASMFAQLAALALEEMHLVAMGSVVSMKYRLRATGRNGREAVLDGVVLFEMNDDDQFTRVTSFYDPSVVAVLMAP